MERKENKEIIKSLVSSFYKDASERDRIGGNPKQERDLIRNSGLLKVLIPKMYGGNGGTWTEVVNITREFAKVDSSLAHVYAYHFVNLPPWLFGVTKSRRDVITVKQRRKSFFGEMPLIQ
jgi:alkylation response protein AidB-like acyl-CoA dehydrogenase